MARIPALLALESKLNLQAYYGSLWRAGWVMIREHFRTLDRYWGAVYWFCDFVGWTKLREFEPGSPHAVRHGGKCDYLNCADMECIPKSIPKWFQKLTRMER